VKRFHSGLAHIDCPEGRELVVLALAVWAYLMLSGGDYSGVIDLTQEIAR
jgi:hypothetical protein